ncbi:MAG: BON domain-containing protein [Actinomycetota bacterium]
MLRFFKYVGLGALIAYFFDPQTGNRRRALARERIPAMFRRSSERVEKAATAVTSEANATKAKVAHRKEAEKPQPDDVTLARKVETEIFRDAEVPKGQINVNAENGKVVLRGEVDKPAMIKDLEKRTRKVQGVTEVENLLHTPESAAPAS